MTTPKLSPETQYRVYVRANNGEKHDDLAREYCVTKILIGRIAKRDPKKMIKDADLVGDFKPRYRRPAVTRPLTVAAAVDQAPAIMFKIPEPKQDVNLLCPPGRPIGLVGLVRKYGTTKQVTGQGSTIVMDHEGKVVRIDACPMYGPNRRFIGVYNVDITEINGVSVKGEARKWSGETVKGSLVIDGLPSPDSGDKIVTRVEFHPDALPKQYVKERAELRRKLL